ncbi:MAG: hypothetical protein ACRDQA_16990 [Nocardioidaceae bacterium]
MRPNPRTDHDAVEAITAAAEQLARDRNCEYTDLTYLQAMSDLAATAEALITTTIAQMDPDQLDWDQIAAALGTTPDLARHDHQPPTSVTTTDF